MKRRESLNNLVKKEQGYEVDGVPVISTSLIAKEFERDLDKVVLRVKEYINHADIIFTENVHYFVLDRSSTRNTGSELFSKNNKQKEVYLLTERGFNKLVMSWRGKKADQVKEHILDVYFKAKEIYEQGVTVPHGNALSSEELDQKINYITGEIEKLSTAITTMQISNLDAFAPHDGGFYRREISRLVRKRASDRKELIYFTWARLYRGFQDKTGVNPSIAENIGLTKIDWIASQGKLKILYDVAKELCSECSSEEAKEFIKNTNEDIDLEDI
jgi:phage regulator Rha-like protein